MSFTIKCNKCGEESVFDENSDRRGKKVWLTVDTEGFYQNEITAIEVWCENEKCNHYIEIKY